MLRYAVRRLIGALPTLVLIAFGAFVLMRLAPGGPFDGERVLPPAIEANLRQVYHLDQPLPVQFFHYLGALLQGDLGPSFKYQDYTVTELIALGFPISARIGGAAIAVAAVLGLGFGTLAALTRNRAVDHLLMGAAMLGLALPSFVIAALLSLVFGIHLGLLPVGGWGDGAVRHLVLPTAALALPQIAAIARLTRASLIEVLNAPYLRTARAKGLPEHRVVLRHALRAAVVPVVSYLGPATAAIVTGSVVVEQIFGIPGLGRHFVLGALNRDYTLVMGVIVFYGALIILFNLIADLLYGVLDPRVRYD